MAEHGGDVAKHNTVFIDTNLDTRLVTIVSDSDTVHDLKRKIVSEHRRCFPVIGDINVCCLKVKRRGNFYHLTDSMLVKSAFGGSKKDWFVTLEASRAEQDGEIRHMDRREAGDQLALPWVTNSRSIDRHDIHADRTSNMVLDRGSPSMRPIILPFVNLKVPSSDLFTSGDSCKDVSKNIGEDRFANDDGWKNPKPDLEKQLTKVQEEVLTVNKAKSKKRTREVQNKSSLEDAEGSGPSLKKRQKTQKLEGSVKALEEDVVSKSDTGKLKQKAASVINEGLFEPGLDSKDLGDENTRGENSSAPDHIEEETDSRKNTEASETVPEVEMALEKNVHPEMPFGIYQMEKDAEVVQQAAVDNEIPSSSMLTGTGHSEAAECSTKPKAAEKEMPSTSFSKQHPNIDKDAMNSSHKGVESAVDQIDKRKRERGEGKKRKSKKSAVKSKDESLVKHADNIVGDISSTVRAQVFDEKLIDERKNDKDTVFSAERNEVSEKTLIDDSSGNAAKKGDDMLVEEVEISEPTETMEERLKKQSKDSEGNIKTVEDVGRASSEGNTKTVEDVGRASIRVDAATVTNEEKLSPHFERKESVEMACIDAVPVNHGRNDDIMMNNGVEVSRTENDKSQVNAKGVNDNSEKPNEKMDVGTKKNKTKKRAKKSAGRSDDVAVVANELPQTEGNGNLDMTSVDPLHIDHVRNDNTLMNNDAELSRTEKNVTQVNAGGINDELHKQNEKMDDGLKKHKKRKAKKSAVRSEDAGIVTTEEKLLPRTEGNENMKMTSVDALHIDHVGDGNIVMNNDVELSKTEKNVTQVNGGGNNDDLKKQTEKMDDGTKKNKKKKATKSAVRSEDVAIVTTEEKLLLQTDGNENAEMTSVEALHIDHVGNGNIVMNNDVELSRTEEKLSEVNVGGIDDLEKQNEKMDDGTQKHKKRKAKKSAVRNEDAAIVTTQEKLLPQTEGNENAEMTTVDALHIDHVGNDNILTNNAVELSKTEKNVTQVNDELPKQNEKMDDGTKKQKKKKAKKSTGRNEDAAIVTTEEKLMPSSDIPKDNYFKDYFVPRHQPENNNATETGEDGKDAKLSGREKKTKKKTEGPSFVETSHDLQQTGEQGLVSLSRKENNKPLLSSKNTPEVSNNVVKDQNTRNTDEVKAPKKTIKTDSARGKENSKALLSSKKTPEVSNNVVKDQNTRNTDEVKTPKRTVADDNVRQKENNKALLSSKKTSEVQSTLGRSHLNNSKKSAPVAKNLLNTPGAIFGDDSDDESTADDNATVGSDSSTRTPSRRSSSSDETDSASSIDTRNNGVKRKDAYGKSTMNSQSTAKKSMSDLLRSSSRFKKARFSASQQVDDPESQPVDFVPESQL